MLEDRLQAPLISAAVLLLTAPLTGLAQDGEAVFQTYCAACHVDPVEENIPPLEAIRRMDPNDIVDTLTVGTMRIQGQLLDDAQHRLVAEYLSGRPVRERAAAFAEGLCTDDPRFPDLAPGQIWNGWRYRFFR